MTLPIDASEDAKSMIEEAMGHIPVTTVGKSTGAASGWG